MAQLERKDRLSADLNNNYQIEYNCQSTKRLSEYRVRRGANRGTWTQWFRTQDMHQVLNNLGFGNVAPTLLTDFYFEGYFGRGDIQLNDAMVKELVDTLNVNDMSAHFYSRITRISEDRWVIPASAIETKRLFNYLRKIIARHNV